MLMECCYVHRIVRHALELEKPVLLLNIGPTRADGLKVEKIEWKSSEVLGEAVTLVLYVNIVLLMRVAEVVELMFQGRKTQEGCRAAKTDEQRCGTGPARRLIGLTCVLPCFSEPRDMFLCNPFLCPSVRCHTHAFPPRFCFGLEIRVDRMFFRLSTLHNHTSYSISRHITKAVDPRYSGSACFEICEFTIGEWQNAKG